MIRITKEILEPLVINNTRINDVALALGYTLCNYKKKSSPFIDPNVRKRIRRYIKEFNIDDSHLDNYNTKVKCLECDILFEKKNKDFRRSTKHFCSQSHAASYNNRNKKYGIRRSKLEVFLEEQISQAFPSLDVEYNYRHPDIGYELDIYFSILSLAIEINGIVHYKPIYGEDKLGKIQAIDKTKDEKCKEHNIALITIPNLASLKTIQDEVWTEVKNIIQSIL